MDYLTRAHSIVDNNETDNMVEIRAVWSKHKHNDISQIKLEVTINYEYPNAQLTPEQVRELLEKMITLWGIQEVHET